MKCIYLIQSDRPKIPYQIPSESEVLLLQWKDNFVPFDNSFHFPNSSWAEGRNELLRRAKKKGDYDYYIFLDDDLKLFYPLQLFEKMLAKINAKRVVPFLLGHGWYRLAQRDLNIVKYVDHAFIAFREDCLSSAFPYTLEYDKVNWWLTCEKFCESFWKIFQNETIRINYLIYLNQKHRDYPKSDYPGLPENIVSQYV